jgi:hypothetical protein
MNYSDSLSRQMRELRICKTFKKNESQHFLCLGYCPLYREIASRGIASNKIPRWLSICH